MIRGLRIFLAALLTPEDVRKRLLLEDARMQYLQFENDLLKGKLLDVKPGKGQSTYASPYSKN